MLQRPLEPTELTPNQKTNYDDQYQCQLINERHQLIDFIESELQDCMMYSEAQRLCLFDSVEIDWTHDRYEDVGDECLEFLEFCAKSGRFKGIAEALFCFAKNKVTEPNGDWRPEPC